MHLPSFQPHALRSSHDGARRVIGLVAITPQGGGLKCIIRCAGALAACAASSNPLECILATAPECADCL